MDFSKRIKEALELIGLTTVQADFYLYVLKSGGASVSATAKALNINRTNSYAIVEKLKSLKLISEENHVSGKILHALSYEPILTELKEKRTKLESLERAVIDGAPIFNSYLRLSDFSGPRIRTYQSKQGLDEIARDILSTTPENEILLLSNQKTEKNFFSKKMHEEFVKTRVKNEIKIRVLAIDNEEGRALVMEDTKVLRETRFLPKEFEFTSEIYIYNGKISMIDVREEIIGLIIESEELYKVHKQMFEEMWKNV